MSNKALRDLKKPSRISRSKASRSSCPLNHMPEAVVHKKIVKAYWDYDDEDYFRREDEKFQKAYD